MVYPSNVSLRDNSSTHPITHVCVVGVEYIHVDVGVCGCMYVCMCMCMYLTCVCMYEHVIRRVVSGRTTSRTCTLKKQGQPKSSPQARMTNHRLYVCTSTSMYSYSSYPSHTCIPPVLTQSTHSQQIKVGLYAVAPAYALHIYNTAYRYGTHDVAGAGDLGSCTR